MADWFLKPHPLVCDGNISKNWNLWKNCSITPVAADKPVYPQAFILLNQAGLEAIEVKVSSKGVTQEVQPSHANVNGKTHVHQETEARF